MTQASQLFSGLQKEREAAQNHTRSVCMDTAQWPQELGLVKPLDQEMVTTGASARTQMVERRAKPQKEQALNCPRCNSTNTKFCYYNNYSLTQPRYFCKTCKRYWTEGGSLRNVPVGGGSRKNKRSSSSTSNNNIGSSSAAVSSSTINPKMTPPPISLSSGSQNPNPKFHEGHDLNLAFPHHGLPDFGGFPNMESRSSCNNNSSSSTSSTRNCSNLELLRSGMSGRGLGHFFPMPLVPEASNVYSSGFGMQDFRPPTLGFPLDGARGGGSTNGYGNMQENAGSLPFPFEDLKPVPASSAHDQFEQSRPVQGGGPPPGFWNAMMGGGGSW